MQTLKQQLMNNRPACGVCGSVQQPYLWLSHPVFRCAQCSLETAEASFKTDFRSDLDNDVRRKALYALRVKNFERILDGLRPHLPPGDDRPGLEIGCGDGWWLETCARHNIACEGIEPETSFAPGHRAHQLQVHYGFYPLEAVAGKQYRFIIFNDVLEHIPGPGSLFPALNANLAPGGVLVVNIPMSTGFIYRCSVLLARLGFRGPAERMWQFRFHSPHINYFNKQNLEQLFTQRGYTCFRTHRLDTLSSGRELKSRLQMDRGLPGYVAVAGAVLLQPLVWLSRLLQPDIRVFFFRKIR